MPVPVRASETTKHDTERPNSKFDAGEFILRACHDLRAATRAVRTQSELLQRGRETPSGSTLDERLELIVDGARQIDLLVDGLAAYSVALQTNPASFRSMSLGVMLRSVLMKLNRDLRRRRRGSGVRRLAGRARATPIASCRFSKISCAMLSHTAATPRHVSR